MFWNSIVAKHEGQWRATPAAVAASSHEQASGGNSRRGFRKCNASGVSAVGYAFVHISPLLAAAAAATAPSRLLVLSSSCYFSFLSSSFASIRPPPACNSVIGCSLNLVCRKPLWSTLSKYKTSACPFPLGSPKPRPTGRRESHFPIVDSPDISTTETTALSQGDSQGESQGEPQGDSQGARAPCPMSPVWHRAMWASCLPSSSSMWFDPRQRCALWLFRMPHQPISRVRPPPSPHRAPPSPHRVSESRHSVAPERVTKRQNHFP